MDNHTFQTLEQGWQTYATAFAHIIKPEDMEEHKRTYMVGAITYDSILFRAVEQLGPHLGTLIIKGIHEEAQAYVAERKAEFMENVVKRN